jgi:hypothetical protein
MRINARRAALAAALGLMAMVGWAEAGVIIAIDQVGSDVVATGSGTIDLTGLTFLSNELALTVLNPSIALIVMGPGAGEVYTGATGPPSFGPGGFITPSSGSGDLIAVQGNGGAIGVPAGYVSGTTLSATDTYASQTFASLGLTPGTYQYTWGTGAHADSLTVQIGPAAVPEPSTLALAGLGALIGAGAWYRRRATRA